MIKDIFQKPLKWIYKNFKENTSIMLIVTGSLGWILSSAAQLGAIVNNKKISNEKKSFLLPQEFMDGFINVGTFLFTTIVFKKGIEKLVKTGKILPESVRTYLEKNKDLYKDKIGKFDFNLDKVLKNNEANAPYETYKTYKNFVTTMGTVGASVLACNVITPVLRNKTASNVQKNYIEIKNNAPVYPKNPNMRI